MRIKTHFAGVDTGWSSKLFSSPTINPPARAVSHLASQAATAVVSQRFPDPRTRLCPTGDPAVVLVAGPSPRALPLLPSSPSLTRVYLHNLPGISAPKLCDCFRGAWLWGALAFTESLGELSARAGTAGGERGALAALSSG